MKISKNDPRLTAYVLNELDALEKTMIENAIKADPELQSEVAQIKKSVGVFNTLAQPQAEMTLSKSQREKIFAKPATSSGWSIWTIGGSLATASLAVILFQQKAHERTDVIVSAPVSESVPAAAPQKATIVSKKQEAKIEQPAPAEMTAVADNLTAPEPAVLAEAKRAEPQELERAKNFDSGAALGATAGAGANFGSVSKAKSATVAARPMIAARMAKDEAAPSAPVAESRVRPQEMPLQLDVSLSQFLPTETEPADVEINMNLTRDLKKCFMENLSKYVRYNLKFNLNWNMQKTRPINIHITDSLNTGLITDEIRNCVKQSFESQNWSDVKYIREALKPLKFEAVVSIVSE